MGTEVVTPSPGYFGRTDDVPRTAGTASRLRTLRVTVKYRQPRISEDGDLPERVTWLFEPGRSYRLEGRRRASSK
jgi:hypothetical protein